jgi:hypothetical protein
MTLEIQVLSWDIYKQCDGLDRLMASKPSSLSWDRYKQCDGLDRLMASKPSSLDNWISTQIFALNQNVELFLAV